MPFPISVPAKAKTTGPLDRDSWTQAALTILARNGIEAVRIERLAKMLAVTKGSFYWHFKDRPSLLEEMLRCWRQRATLGVIERLEKSPVPPAQRLRHLLKLLRNGPHASRGADIEAAIRLWGRSDPRVASVVLEIDRLRLGHIKSLVEAAHDGSMNAAARAALIYAHILTHAWLAPAIDEEVLQQCDEILDGS